MLRYLALLPLLHFIIIAVISKLNKNLGLLKCIYAIMYLDWLFVPFNYFIAISVDFSWPLLLTFMAVSLAVLLLLHKKWHSNLDKLKYGRFFFNKHGPTPEGWTHFVFMLLESAIVVTAIFSAATSPYYVYAMISLLAYLVGYFVVVTFIWKELNSKIEVPFVILGIIAVIVRTAIYFLF
jgi:hypothetical protein